MSRKRIVVFSLIFLAFLVAFILITLDVFRAEAPPEIYNVSVIVRGKNSDSWENIKQGADQAASEMNVDLSFITLSEENSLEEQIALLERESQSGVDAIVLSAADSEGVAETVDEIALRIPVICIESPARTDAVTSFISADNSEMGEVLGREIVASGNARKRLALVESAMASDSVRQREEGLMRVLAPIGGEIDVWRIPDDTAEASAVLASLLDGRTADVIVTLDTTSLELAGQAISDDQSSYLDLFGIGASGKIASFIERDIVTATVVQNDFGIGYLGVKAAVDAIERRPVAEETVVEHRVINWNNMYDLENQRLLFPFIR